MMPDLPQTEAVAQENADLDRLPAEALVERLIDSQRDVVDAVLAERHAIAVAVEEIATRIARGGRLHYVGAGTSGRLGTLDAAEIPPTFGAEPDLVVAHIAGGSAALVRSIEGAEDDATAGRDSMAEVQSEDAVVGISASGRAPFVVAALAAAKEKGCLTIAIVSEASSPLAQAAEHAIAVRTGAEPIAGSTRMRAGTAQKVILNTISTAVMVLRGNVYQNLMVDLVATNEKLRARATRLVERLAGVDAMQAATLLISARGSVKTAIVMARCGCDEETARALLAKANGSLRLVIGE